MADIILESDNGYGWATVPPGQQPTKRQVITFRTGHGYGWTAEAGGGGGALLPVDLPELTYGNVVLVGSPVGHIPGNWGPGVTVTREYVIRANGAGPWLGTGVTSGEYTAANVADIIGWRERGVDADGRTGEVISNTVQVWAVPVMATPAVLSYAATTPGTPYTSTAATFTGFPTPQTEHAVQRQLGTTGAIETVAASGTFAEGYRYRPATRGYNAADETWDYGASWTAIVAVPAVAPTVSLSRSPAGTITEGDTVTITAVVTGTPTPVLTFLASQDGEDITLSGTGVIRTIASASGGSAYDITGSATNSAGTATDTLSFTVVAASTDVPPYVISNPALPALTEGVPATAPAATFGGTPTPTASHKIQRRLGGTGTIEEVGAGLNFTPAANYQYRRVSTGANGVLPNATSESPWSDTVAQVDWAFTEADGVITIVKSPGQPPTPSVTDITYNSARIVPGTVATPAFTGFAVMPLADWNPVNPELSQRGNLQQFTGTQFNSPAPKVDLMVWRRSAKGLFTTAAAPIAPEFADTFDAATGDLAGHQSDSEHIWAAPVSGTMRITAAGRLRGTTNNSGTDLQLTNYELPSSGGYVEAIGRQAGGGTPPAAVRRAGTLSVIALYGDTANYLYLSFFVSSSGSTSDAIIVHERVAGSILPRITHPMPGLGDAIAEHTARVVINRSTKALTLLVDGTQVATGSYTGTYPVGSKLGARWAASVSQTPSENGAMQFVEISAGRL